MGLVHPRPTPAPEYPKLIHFEMKNLDIIGNHSTKMGFLVSDPISQYSLTAILDDFPVSISGCILPGVSLTTSIQKKCQDNYSFVLFQNTLLLMLFDGHGPTGHFIAEHCIDFFTQYFYKNFKDFMYDTQEAFKEMFCLCDESLGRTEIDCSASGSTAVAVLVTSTHLHCASVGDSRAILVSGTVTDLNNYVQLTTDQKPNHKEEYHRIIASGGEVKRYTNEAGYKKGPYRIWKPSTLTPGLAMSRSLGDFLAKSIGVIPAPLYTSTILNSRDKYIIISTDGIWDVLSNQIVADFIITHHDLCSVDPTCLYPATYSNSTISRLLCEHARSKWFQADNIGRSSIDDISSLIVKISDLKTKVRERVLKFNCTMNNDEYCVQDIE